MSTQTFLVIDSRNLESLDIDGPALKVRMRTESTRLFPLRRLSRIHVIGTIRDGLDTLLHCAESQIPVAFFNIHGKLRCQLYYPVFVNSNISHWLEHVEFDVQARELYNEWILHHSLHVLSTIGFSDGPRETRLSKAEERLREECNKQMGRAQFRNAMDWLYGISSAHISQIVLSYGLANQYSRKRRLMEDLFPLVTMMLIYSLCKETRNRKIAVTAKSMSQMYQRQADQIEYTIRRMLSQLEARLESII